MAASKRNKEDIAELKEVFNMYDKNKDGSITVKELAAVMKSFGQDVTDSEMNTIFASVDTNGDGSIGFKEFLSVMNRKMDKKEEKEMLLDAFKVFDINGNGLISREEMKQTMASLGNRLSDVQLDELMQSADVNGDGNINYTEFVAMMKKY